MKDAYGAEWAYIPHFYYNFYVYQYATSVIASVKLADGIRAEAEGDASVDGLSRRLPQDALRRLVPLRLRHAEGGRRGHGDLGAVRGRDARHERHDRRDGADSRQARDEAARGGKP